MSKHLDKLKALGALVTPIQYGARMVELELKAAGLRKRSVRYLAFPILANGCWEWSGKKNDKGYGQLTFTTDKTRYVGAHRWMYELLEGPIPKGLVIDHLCRNHSCVNPAHMEVVTNKENLARGFSPSAENYKKTACKHGHAFNTSNTYTDKAGKRHCRECCRIRDNKRRTQ